MTDLPDPLSWPAWVERVLELLERYPQITWGLVALSLGTLVASVILVPALVVRLPEDYYLELGRRPRRRGARWLGLTLVVLRNALGLLVLLAGIAMLVLPGQGILTVLAGLALLDFPGKRRLELMILRRRKVLEAINWVRRRAGRPPLRLPPRDAPPSGPGQGA